MALTDLTGSENSSCDIPAGYAAGRRVTLWGMVLNVALSAFKVTAGIIGQSQAVIADGIHTFSDLGSDIVVLIGLKVSEMPSDQTHHYGHRKFETLSTVALGAMLTAAGAFIGYESLVSISQRHQVAPTWLPAIAAAVSILSKEALYRWTAATGRKIGSSSVAANAYHHRSDAFSSVPVLIGLLVIRLEPSLGFLDHLIAFVVAVYVVQVGVGIAYRETLDLVDSAPGREVMQKVERSILDVRGVCSLHQCRARRIQGKIFVDVHIQVQGDMTVTEGHRISGIVKYKVMQVVADVAEVLVHVEPVGPAAQGIVLT